MRLLEHAVSTDTPPTAGPTPSTHQAIRHDGPVNHNQYVAVLRAAQAMRDDLSETLTVDALANLAFFSKYHFTRVFQRCTGLPPGRFLAELRVMMAEHLLLTSELSFTEITYQVGYASVGTFSTRFKEVLGVPPSDYRRHSGLYRSPLVDAEELRPNTAIVLRTLQAVRTVLEPGQDETPRRWTLGMVPARQVA
jgi:AraC-like DNA-binding protein